MIGASEVYMPWNKWSWSAPQSPIEYFFRRNVQENMPIKSPEFECQCPPSKACSVEFKINEAMGDFLSMRGVLTGDAAKNYQQDIEELQKHSSLSPREYIKEKRLRRSNIEEEEKCCCPPRSLMMPTFITDSRFDEIVSSLDKKEVAPNLSIKNF